MDFLINCLKGFVTFFAKEKGQIEASILMLFNRTSRFAKLLVPKEGEMKLFSLEIWRKKFLKFARSSKYWGEALSSTDPNSV